MAVFFVRFQPDADFAPRLILGAGAKLLGEYLLGPEAVGNAATIDKL